MLSGIVPKGKNGVLDGDVKGAGKPCTYCRRTMKAWTPTHPTRDHVVPVSKGGRETVWACHQCNNLKGDSMPDVWAAFMAATPDWWNTPGAKVPKGPPTHGPCPVLAAAANALAEDRYPHAYVNKVASEFNRMFARKK